MAPTPRFRKPQIDGDAAAAVLAGRERAPIGYAAAVRTEMKAKVPASPGIDLSQARYAYPFVFVVIGPEHPVASADVQLQAVAISGVPSKLQRTARMQSLQLCSPHYPFSKALAI